MIIPLSVKNQSIETSGITKDYREALCEYIWNGFEANATEVKITFTKNDLSGIDKIMISDNGDGIDYNDINETFGAFLASKKNSRSLKLKTKANKGKGRFSFTAFASYAEWATAYTDTKGTWEYTIKLNDANKQIVECNEPILAPMKETQTTVTFGGIVTIYPKDLDYPALEDYFLEEYSWFLYLNQKKNYQISINGQQLDYKKYINTAFSENVSKIIDGIQFNINLVVWAERIKEKYCCYFFDSFDVVKGIDTTTFNRNTVGFNHSVFVRSQFFDKCQNVFLSSDQMVLGEQANDHKIMKGLKEEIQKLISQKLNVFMLGKADDALQEMIETKKTFPSFSNDLYCQIRKRDLIRVTKELYCLEPRIFYKLKEVQEKSLLGFLNLLLSSEERENVLSIIEQIVELSTEQRKNFAEMLKKTKLENVIDTIKFIEDRYRVIEILKTLVYDLTKFTNERNHIQKLVEQHYWLFGEQYHLASADQRMQKALQQYTNILYGERSLEVSLNPDIEAERRMDIFLCSARKTETSFETSLEENIVIELKAPKVPLSKVVLRQIEDYMDFIRRQPQFNSPLRRWKFIAVCREIDDDVKSRYSAFEDKGKPGLVFQVDSYEVYALTWDDIFKGFDLRHSFLLDRLNYDREQLSSQMLTDEVAKSQADSDELTQTAVNI